VQWIYRSYGSATVTDEYDFDRALTYNVLTKAFYPWSFANHAVKINAIGAYATLATSKADVPSVDDEGFPILDSHLEPVVTRENVTNSTASVFKYFCTYTSGTDFIGTFAEAYDDTFVDFNTIDGAGQDYDSYIVTGYRLDGKADKKFQSNYVTVYFRSRDEGALDVQAVWNSANSTTSGYWGQKQRISVDSTRKRDFDSRKIKARGNGKVLQLKFSSVTGKPFELAGWAITETINSRA